MDILIRIIISLATIFWANSYALGKPIEIYNATLIIKTVIPAVLMFDCLIRLWDRHVFPTNLLNYILLALLALFYVFSILILDFYSLTLYKIFAVYMSN